MYPPTDPSMDPLGMGPAPQAPAAPAAVQPKTLHPVAESIAVALAALAGQGRGTGILTGLNLANQQAQQRAQLENQRLAQDYARRHQVFQDEQRAYQQQQEQRAAMLKQMVDSFQSELANTNSDTEAENLYQTAGSVLASQGFRGYDVASLKRRYKSPDMMSRANKAIAKWMANPINKQAFENDPESIGRITIEVGGAPMTIAQAQALTGGATPTSKPKQATPRQPAAIGSFEDYIGRTYGENPTPAQILEGRRAFNTADNAPVAPRPKVPIMRNGRMTWVEQGTQQDGDMPYQASGQTPKEPSQGQYTTAGYAARVQQAESVLSKLESDIAGMGQMSFSAQSASPTAKLQSDTFQSYDQASRNFINAVLRRESGAAISPSEFDSARKQYLPQPGDTTKNLNQKRANRQLVFDNLRAASGGAYQPPPDAGVTDVKQSALDKLKGR